MEHAVAQGSPLTVVVNGLASVGRDHLNDSVNRDAALTEAGRLSFERAMAALIRTNRQLEKLLRRNPEVATQPLPFPVFVTGLHRSGTTLLHRLLASHPGLRAPALWELQAPADPADRRVLRVRAHEYVREYNEAAPGFAAAHRLDADEPDECHRLMASAFRSWIFCLRYRVPGYRSWLERQDMEPAYRHHRLLLQAIAWRSGAQRMVLKDPFHLLSAAPLGRAYPDALVVRVHRDPAVAVPSACALTMTIRSARSDRVDPLEIGAEWLAHTDRAVRTMVPGGWSDHCPVRTIDVHYADLMADPLRVAATVCEQAGLSLERPAKEQMKQFLAQDEAAHRGRHQYTASRFGLDEGRLSKRYRAYRDLFGIAPAKQAAT